MYTQPFISRNFQRPPVVPGVTSQDPRLALKAPDAACPGSPVTPGLSRICPSSAGAWPGPDQTWRFCPWAFAYLSSPSGRKPPPAPTPTPFPCPLFLGSVSVSILLSGSFPDCLARPSAITPAALHTHCNCAAHAAPLTGLRVLQRARERWSPAPLWGCRFICNTRARRAPRHGAREHGEASVQRPGSSRPSPGCPPLGTESHRPALPGPSTKCASGPGPAGRLWAPVL